MRWLRVFALRVAGLFAKSQRDREFAAELDGHLQMHIDDNLRSGMSAQEARRQALLKLGGVEPIKEIYRERRGLPLLETVLQDLRYAVRTLRKNPGFTLIAVLTLALGIGANTAIFSMVNALLLHPYNFPELDRLVRVWENRGIDEGADARFIAPQDAADLLSGTPVFDALTTYKCGDFNVSAEGNVQPVLGCHVSANFFDVLGVGPALGRAFSASEEQPGADQVAVVSYGFWQRRFAGDAGLLGKTIQMNGKKYAVVGIMPRGFDYPVPMELWVPLGLSPSEKTDRAKLSLESLGRLKLGVSVAQARSAADSVSQRLQQEYPICYLRESLGARRKSPCAQRWARDAGALRACSSPRPYCYRASREAWRWPSLSGA
jgi:macrolide transport system ATP-binding/permease protein